MEHTIFLSKDKTAFIQFYEQNIEDDLIIKVKMELQIEGKRYAIINILDIEELARLNYYLENSLKSLKYQRELKFRNK